LVVPRNDLAEDIVFEARSFSRVKTQDLRSGDNKVDSFFSFLEALFLENLCCSRDVIFGSA
jgi:hypothetical protein